MTTSIPSSNGDPMAAMQSPSSSPSSASIAAPGVASPHNFSVLIGIVVAMTVLFFLLLAWLCHRKRYRTHLAHRSGRSQASRRSGQFKHFNFIGRSKRAHHRWGGRRDLETLAGDTDDEGPRSNFQVRAVTKQTTPRASIPFPCQLPRGSEFGDLGLEQVVPRPEQTYVAPVSAAKADWRS